MTPNQFRALADACVATEHPLAPLLERYSAAWENRIRELSAEAKQELAFQKEAIGTALGIAGIARAPLQQWAPPVAGVPASFLEGLPEAYVREAAMLHNDLTNVPGYSLLRTSITGAAVFQGDDGAQLTIVLANQLPLEQLTGADLLYYNHRFSSFVMVQYKAMERTTRGEAEFRLPNVKLDEEIARMDRLIQTIRNDCEPDTCSGFRLSWNPFFLKLCPRIVLNPDDTALTKGMYIALDNWKLLTQSESTLGPRGGRAVTYSNVGRHLDNTQFIMLVSQAWVGTTPKQSVMIDEVVRQTLKSGRAAVLAVQK